jgi:hypothetical protein
MEKHWKSLPGHRLAPPGMERVVLRKLPGVALMGTLTCAALAVFARIRWAGDPTAEAFRALQMADIWALSTAILFWTALVLVAIFCFVVLVMKGPAYVADRYDLPDSDKPD